MKRIALALVALAAVLALVGGAGRVDRADAKAAATVNVQLIALNDYHGQLEPPSGSGGRIGTPAVDAGGIEYLATHVKGIEAQNPNTLVVGAGDFIGATPLVSALFHDEPSIESMNLIGLDVTSVGNHEFDEGWQELLRMQRGGCHPKDGCQDGTPFEGAKFQYLSANVELLPQAEEKAAYAAALAAYNRAQANYRVAVAKYRKALASYNKKAKAKRAACKKSKTSRACKKRIGSKPKAPRRPTVKRPTAPGAHPLLPAMSVKTIGGVKVGFIGMTLEGTPTIVTPTAVAGLMFLDEIQTANKYVAELQKQNVQAIVVLIHEGGIQSNPADPNGCVGISGPIVDIANGISNAVDVIISGHTHQAYNCMIGSKIVTSAASVGRLLTDIDLDIDTATGEVTKKSAVNVIVTRTVAKDPNATSLFTRYQQLAAPLANRVIGSITGNITRTANRAGESALGDVIADAQLETSKDPAKGAAVVAFMNPGGIRADLTASQISGGEQAGQVTYGEAFTVQPFGNTVVVKTCTGDQIKRILEQQFDNPSASADRVLQVSNGFTYTYTRSAAAGNRVDFASIKINGTPIVAATQYRVSLNSFLADGGDNFTVFRECTNPLGGEVDLDALAAYFGAKSPVAPGPQNRITRTD
jgi:5'-nucleotidase